MLICGMLALQSNITTVSAKVRGRKKVAVVLSGGGAKGAAHAGVLKVIEEAGIPIDYIVGTSIGALVGGMYASGYNADQIDSIMSHQNWKTLLTDTKQRGELDILHRQYIDRYILTSKFDRTPNEIVEGGVLKGNKVAKLLTELTADTPDSIDFNKLKIPFACVATDVATGEEIDMHSGVLAECMRASMAIPGVFAPVRKGARVLADGGMTNNFPVDVARRMGADYVIGVSLSRSLADAEHLKTTMNVTLQMVDIICRNKLDENIANTDLYINVDVKGYSSASFNNKAIDSLIVRGNKAAREKWDELIALREKIGMDAPLPVPEPRELPKNTDITPVASIYSDRSRENFLGIGARFDNEELASLLVGGMYEINHKNKLRVGFTGRLGKRMGAELVGAVNLNKTWTAQLAYNYTYNSYKLYDRGNHVSNEEYSGHQLQLDFARNWNNVRAMVGVNYSFYHFADPLVNKDYFNWADYLGDERSYAYFVRVTYDNRDAHSNAHRGLYWSIGYQFLTNNGLTFYGDRGHSILDANLSVAIPLSSKCTLTPTISGRWVPADNDYFTQLNMIGGVNTTGHYMPHHIAFAGINHIELANNKLLVAGATLQQFISKKNYLFMVANYGKSAGEVLADKKIEDMVGAALGYGYKTSIGPVEVNLNWSNVTRAVGFNLNLGYMF